MNPIVRFFYAPVHWIAHLFKSNEGRVISWTDRDRVFVAFKCTHCGKLQGVQSITSPNFDSNAEKLIEDPKDS